MTHRQNTPDGDSVLCEAVPPPTRGGYQPEVTCTLPAGHDGRHAKTRERGAPYCAWSDGDEYSTIYR
jgi:hypothetical protein